MRGLWVPAVLVGLLAVLAYVLWPRGTVVPSSTRVIQEITVVQPPPPPPPTPEEKIMEREPDIVTPSDTPRPVEAEPTPTDAADAPSSTSEAAGLDRPADAGSDSFSLAAGGGGGLFGRGGSGGGGDGWGGFVEAHVRRALMRDTRTRAASGSLRVLLQIETNGRFTGARLLSGTGNAKLDTAILTVLGQLQPLERQRPPRFGADTFLTIDMRRIDVGNNG